MGRSRKPIGSTALLVLIGSYCPSWSADTVVKVGVVGAISDAPFFIAAEKGYFREEGIAVDFVTFKEASQMAAPLATGELDVGAGAPSAALYNAIIRGADIRIVADKGSMPAQYGFMPLVVRKDLIESGRFKSLADLKGLRIGSQSPGGAATATLGRALKEGGLQWNDITITYMGHPQLALAIDSNAIDAGFITEPNATNAVRLGHAVKVMRGDQVYPDQQLSVVLYAGAFLEKYSKTADTFMRAYLRGARFYNQALKDGRLKGERAGEVIEILSHTTDVKDPHVYEEIIPAGCDPDGRVNVESLKSDYETFRTDGLVQGDVQFDKVVDPSFARAAVATLASASK